MSETLSVPEAQIIEPRKSIVTRMRSILERLHSDSRKTYQYYGFADLNAHWFGPLTLLRKHGPLGVKQISTALQLAAPSVTQSLKSLENEGLIRFEKDPSDGRKKTVHLTAKGEQTVQKLEPLWDAFLQVAHDLDKESEGILAALDRLDAAITRMTVFDRVRSLMDTVHRP